VDKDRRQGRTGLLIAVGLQVGQPVRPRDILRRAKVKLQRALNDYAITDNTQMCRNYRHEVESLLFKWLNRRGQRRSYAWPALKDALRWVRWPRVVIKHDLNPCRS